MKLQTVIRIAVDVLTNQIREEEKDDQLVPVVLNVGNDAETDTYLRDLQSQGVVQLFVDFDNDGLVPELIIFSGEKIGMETGIEFLSDTTTVICCEDQSGSLSRRNTSAIHMNAGKFSDFVYLDECTPHVIVYSNYSEVIQEVGKPLPPDGYSNMVQNLEVNPDFSREDIMELGKKTPYYKPADFPIEVAVEFDPDKNEFREVSEDFAEGVEDLGDRTTPAPWGDDEEDA